MTVILEFKITWGSIFSPDATKTTRAFKRILAGVNQAMGEYWHTKILPRHFNKGAQRRYGYKPRSKKYLKRKAREMGRSTDQWQAMRDFPLQFTGVLRDRVTRFAQVKAAASKFSVTMFGPHYGNRKGGGGEGAYQTFVAGKSRPSEFGGGRGEMPNMVAEITTLLESEQEELRQHAQKMLPSVVARESKRVQKKTVFYKG